MVEMRDSAKLDQQVQAGDEPYGLGYEIGEDGSRDVGGLRLGGVG